MNKTDIKNFAIWARQKLIGDITYKAGLIGVTEKGAAAPLPQSAGNLQFFDIGTKEPAAVKGRAIGQRDALVRAISEKAGENGWQAAFQSIAEEVAYTWFNRMIALRFMEVNDYLPSRTRVLSSETPGKLEPDFVTAPFEAEVSFTEQEQAQIALLQDENRLDELFQLLFIKQCNELYKVLPALFEPTSDYTELLLTLSFTDKDGVVYRLTHDIPEEDFKVKTDEQEQDENRRQEDPVWLTGWLYQYYNAEPKEQVFADLKKNIKISKENIPAATQLFTPHWIVRYMVENSLGRLWLEGHPDDSLKENWKYYLDEAGQEPQVQAELAKIRAEYAKLNPEDIKIIDPCMGSGHILVYAFELLMQIYEARGYASRDAARLIVEKNLYGLDIDRRAYQLAYFAVMMKARSYDRRFLTREVEPNLAYPGPDRELQAFGSLLPVREETLPKEKEDGQLGLFDISTKYRRMLAGKYDVVCTNPPYMAASNANNKMQDYVKAHFPDSKSDLFACFIEKCARLIKKAGLQAMITQHSWMFLSSFEKLRDKLQRMDTVNMVHLGARAFEEIGGEVVQTTSFVFRNSRQKGYKGT